MHKFISSHSLSYVDAVRVVLPMATDHNIEKAVVGSLKDVRDWDGQRSKRVKKLG